jgi:hypothetical protein
VNWVVSPDVGRVHSPNGRVHSPVGRVHFPIFLAPYGFRSTY